MCVTLKSSQLQRQVLAKIFGYFPDTVFLISENGQVYSGDDQFSYIPDNDLTCFGESFVPPFEGTSSKFKYCYQTQDNYHTHSSKEKGR